MLLLLYSLTSPLHIYRDFETCFLHLRDMAHVKLVQIWLCAYIVREQLLFTNFLIWLHVCMRCHETIWYRSRVSEIWSSILSWYLYRWFGRVREISKYKKVCFSPIWKPSTPLLSHFDFRLWLIQSPPIHFWVGSEKIRSRGCVWK
jgi:hypothetical protein